MKIKALAQAAEEAAAFLKATAHPARLRMICALLPGECAAGELARSAGLRAPALSQQAAVLEAGGLLSRRRAGQVVYYRLASEHAERLAHFLHDSFCRGRRGARPRRHQQDH